MSQAGEVLTADEGVPPVDLRGDAFADNPRKVLAEALARGPVAKSKRGYEFLSYSLISDAFLDDKLDTAGPDHYERLGAGESVIWFVNNGLLSTMARTRHDPIRRLMLKAFSFRNIEAQRAEARRTATEMLETWIGDGEVDIIRQLTEYYPIRVMSAMIGIPREDIPGFAEAAHELHLLAAVPMAPGFPRLEVALEELKSYVRRLVEARRAEPQDDFVSALLAAQEVENKLSEDELIGNLVNLIFAGMGTTTKQFASAIHDIVKAGLWEELYQHPDELGDMINESLRFSPVTQFVVRIVQDDTVLGGREYPKGTRILLNLLAASRDPEKFTDPDRFDITRVNDESRLPFGWGVHRCLGQPLARLLIEEGLTLMSNRMTEVTVTDRDRGPHPAEMLGGSTSMTLSFSAR
ncbi:MAG: cytochrome monooxygenase [Microbacteriaceae bacterium]|nr:cytochrome monooxygenase [Microbacteriaceae bacterium]